MLSKNGKGKFSASLGHGVGTACMAEAEWSGLPQTRCVLVIERDKIGRLDDEQSRK